MGPIEELVDEAQAVGLPLSMSDVEKAMINIEVTGGATVLAPPWESGKRRAGITTNKRQGTSKARRKMTKQSRRVNRR